MTVITLTTTGYGDMVPKTDQGKQFTMMLLMMGVGALTYSVSTIISYIGSIDFTERRRIKMEKMIVVGIRKPNKKFIFNPGGDYQFEEGDCIITKGDQDSYCNIRDRYHLTSFQSHEKGSKS